MPVFRNEKELQRVIGGFFAVASRPRTYEELRKKWGHRKDFSGSVQDVERVNEAGNTIRKAGVCVVFRFSQPDAVLVVDGRYPPPGQFYQVKKEIHEEEPDIIVHMTGDTAHQFLSGKIRPSLALATGAMRLKGSKAKALRLLKAISPALMLYPDYLRYTGYRS